MYFFFSFKHHTFLRMQSDQVGPIRFYEGHQKNIRTNEQGVDVTTTCSDKQRKRFSINETTVQWRLFIKIVSSHVRWGIPCRNSNVTFWVGTRNIISVVPDSSNDKNRILHVILNGIHTGCENTFETTGTTTRVLDVPGRISLRIGRVVLAAMLRHFYIPFHDGVRFIIFFFF